MMESNSGTMVVDNASITSLPSESMVVENAEENDALFTFVDADNMLCDLAKFVLFNRQNLVAFTSDLKDSGHLEFDFATDEQGCRVDFTIVWNGIKATVGPAKNLTVHDLTRKMWQVILKHMFFRSPHDPTLPARGSERPNNLFTYEERCRFMSGMLYHMLDDVNNAITKAFLKAQDLFETSKSFKHSEENGVAKVTCFVECRSPLLNLSLNNSFNVDGRDKMALMSQKNIVLKQLLKNCFVQLMQKM